MPDHPLHNIQQRIYEQRGGDSARYLLVSTVKEGRWEVALWHNSKGDTSVWAGEGDDSRSYETAEAIEKGFLHLQERPDGGLKLFINVAKPVITVYLDKEEPDKHLGPLVEGSFDLLSRPKVPTANSDIRALRSQLEEKDAEIASLTAKILSLRATVSRQTATGPKRDGPTSPAKKAPPQAILNRLQPNQKRRKLVEEEFAGSDEESEDDDDGDEDEDDDDIEEDGDEEEED